MCEMSYISVYFANHIWFYF